MNAQVTPISASGTGPTAHCLECGYILAGIPETRCPECGFGFTRQSTLWMAQSFARVKINVYDRVLYFSLASFGLSVTSFALSSWWTAALVVLGLVPAGGLLGLVSAAKVAGPILQMYGSLTLLGLAVLFIGKLRWPAAILVAIPVVMLLSLPRAYPCFELSLGSALRTKLARSRMVTYAALIAAVAALVIC